MKTKNTQSSKADETKDQDRQAVDESTSSETTQNAPAHVDPDAALQTRIETLEDNLLRAKADYQNLLRRSATEQSQAIRFANADLLRSLVTVIDDFDRSLAAAKSSDNLKAVVEGVRLVRENFLKALASHGLTPIEALHQPFDPSVHEAILQQPSAEHPGGTVLEEIAKGYMLEDRVIRPAKVIVSKRADD